MANFSRQSKQLTHYTTQIHQVQPRNIISWLCENKNIENAQNDMPQKKKTGKAHRLTISSVALLNYCFLILFKNFISCFLNNFWRNFNPYSKNKMKISYPNSYKTQQHITSKHHLNKENRNSIHASIEK